MKTTPQFSVSALLLAAAFSAGIAAPAAAEGSSRQAKVDQYCAKNPARCERFKQRASEWKAECAADPAACEARKAAARERLEAVKAKCSADPVACAARKEQLRQQREALASSP